MRDVQPGTRVEFASGNAKSHWLSAWHVCAQDVIRNRGGVLLISAASEIEHPSSRVLGPRFADAGVKGICRNPCDHAVTTGRIGGRHTQPICSQQASTPKSSPTASAITALPSPSTPIPTSCPANTRRLRRRSPPYYGERGFEKGFATCFYTPSSCEARSSSNSSVLTSQLFRGPHHRCSSRSATMD